MNLVSRLRLIIPLLFGLLLARWSARIRSGGPDGRMESARW